MGDKQKPFIGKRSDAHRLHLDNKFIVKGFRCNYSTNWLAI